MLTKNEILDKIENSWKDCQRNRLFNTAERYRKMYFDFYNSPKTEFYNLYIDDYGRIRSIGENQDD